MTAALTSAAAEPFVHALVIDDRDRAFVVSFGQVVRAASWAIVGGGLVDAEHVAWVEVRDTELGPDVDPRAFLAQRLRRERLTRAVGLLTSRRVTSRVDRTSSVGAVSARSLTTVGLGNALCAGDPPWAGARVGTINVLVHVDTPLTDEGLLEANAIATEAKTLALFDAGVRSRRSGKLATGTGTDCTVVTCPRPTWGKPPEPYAGKHTAIGAAIGDAVQRALRDGIEEWRRDVA
jgi:adenosylcobinamide amidohydrolase